ncbi:hypothetical protein BS17DRAFT_85486 [Gyrodon lividus]|nr:hypothetical protein BS17DRAFT_85486 [Gyrodon lividus]
MSHDSLELVFHHHMRACTFNVNSLPYNTLLHPASSLFPRIPRVQRLQVPTHVHVPFSFPCISVPDACFPLPPSLCSFTPSLVKRPIAPHIFFTASTKPT